MFTDDMSLFKVDLQHMSFIFKRVARDTFNFMRYDCIFLCVAKVKPQIYFSLSAKRILCTSVHLKLAHYFKQMSSLQKTMLKIIIIP